MEYLASYTSKNDHKLYPTRHTPSTSIGQTPKQRQSAITHPTTSGRSRKGNEHTTFLETWKKILTGICISQTIKNYRVRNLLSWQKRLESQYIWIGCLITKVYAPLLIQIHMNTSRYKLGVACDSANHY